MDKKPKPTPSKPGRSKRLAVALVLALAAGVAYAHLTQHLVAQWRGPSGLMCQYQDGTVINVGYRSCPATIPRR